MDSRLAELGAATRFAQLEWANNQDLDQLTNNLAAVVRATTAVEELATTIAGQRSTMRKRASQEWRCSCGHWRVGLMLCNNPTCKQYRGSQLPVGGTT